jgi:hypothetical protein
VRRASLDLRRDAASAVELASRRHLDGLIIDRDGLAGGTEALTDSATAARRFCHSFENALVSRVNLLLIAVGGQAVSVLRHASGGGKWRWTGVTHTGLSESLCDRRHAEEGRTGRLLVVEV